MSHEVITAMMSRISTDSAFYQLFFTDQATALADYDLDDIEVKALATVTQTRFDYQRTMFMFIQMPQAGANDFTGQIVEQIGQTIDKLRANPNLNLCPQCNGDGVVQSQRKTLFGQKMEVSECSMCDGIGFK